MRRLILFLFLLQVACQEVPKGPIRSYVLLHYTTYMLEYSTEGSVPLTAVLGEDGKVEAVVLPTVPPEGFWGPRGLLVGAARRNLCKWTFEPPLKKGYFPIKHDIEYVFKLEGDPVENPKTRHILHLPHRIEIISQPGIHHPLGTSWHTGYLMDRAGERPVIPCQPEN